MKNYVLFEKSKIYFFWPPILFSSLITIDCVEVLHTLNWIRVNSGTAQIAIAPPAYFYNGGERDYFEWSLSRECLSNSLDCAKFVESKPQLHHTNTKNSFQIPNTPSHILNTLSRIKSTLCCWFTLNSRKIYTLLNERYTWDWYVKQF